MSKQWKPGRSIVELRPSRIRRDPPPPVRPAVKEANFFPEVRETWVVAVGVILFALALAIIIIGFSDITSG